MSASSVEPTRSTTLSRLPGGSQDHGRGAEVRGREPGMELPVRRGWSGRQPVLLGLALLTVMTAILGCDNPEGIRTYTVKKQQASNRMLAAILPRGDEAWFFKLTGDNEAVAAEQPRFDALIQSVQFSDSGEPKWELPAGWQQQPGSMMRFATLTIESGGETLECSVSKLPRTEAPLEEYLLANINRWRGQMRQPPLRASELTANSSTIELASGDLKATVVNIEGDLSGGGMGAAPFAGSAARPPFAGSGAAAPAASTAAIQFDKPEGWTEGELVMSRGGISVRRDAAFDVRDGERSVEITVTKLPAAAGATLPNVNRWRGQIGLEPLTAEQLKTESKQLDFAGQPADYVQFFGSNQAILGVIAEREGMVWFVKLQGDTELAGRERQNFENFAKSIRWE